MPRIKPPHCRFRPLRTERLEDRRLLSATDPRGLASEWYDGSFDDSVEASRIDQEVSFRWGEGGPGLDIHHDFSARWTGTLTPPRDDRYVFTILKSAGDQVGLRINGTEVINAQAGTSANADSVSGTIDLTGDEPVAIELEYTNPDGEARVELRWKGNATPDQVVPVRYLSNDAKATLVPGVVREVFAGRIGTIDGHEQSTLRPETVVVAGGLDHERLLPDGSEGNSLGAENGVTVYQESILRPEVSGWYQFGVQAFDAAELMISRDGRAENLSLVASTERWVWNNYFQDPSQVSEPIYLEAGNEYPVVTNTLRPALSVFSRFHWRMVDGPGVERYSRTPDFDFIPSSVLYKAKPIVSLTAVRSQAGVGDNYSLEFRVDLNDRLARDITVELTVSNSNAPSQTLPVTIEAFTHGQTVTIPAEEIALGEELRLQLVPTPNVRLDVPSKQFVVLTRTDPDEFIEGQLFDMNFTRFNNPFNAGRFDQYVDPQTNIETYQFSQTVNQDHGNRLIWNENAPTFEFVPARIRFQARALNDVARIEVWTQRNDMAVRSRFDVSKHWRPYEMNIGDLASNEVWLTLDEINKTVEVRNLSLIPLLQNSGLTGVNPKKAEHFTSIALRNATAERNADAQRRTQVRSIVQDASGQSVPGAEVKMTLVQHAIDSHASIDDSHFGSEHALRLTRAIVDEYFTGAALTDDSVGWKAWSNSPETVRHQIEQMLDVGDLTLSTKGGLLDSDIPDDILADIQALQRDDRQDDAKQLLYSEFESYMNFVLDGYGAEEKILYWENWLPVTSRRGVWLLLSDSEMGELITRRVEERGFSISPVATASGFYRFDDVVSWPHSQAHASQELFVDSAFPLPRPVDLRDMLDQSPGFLVNRILSGFNFRFEPEFSSRYLASLIAGTAVEAMGLPQYSMISPGLIWDGAFDTPIDSGLWFSQDWVEGPAAKAWADLWLTEYADQSRMHTSVDGVAQTRLMKGTYEVTVTLPSGETITKMIDTENPAFDTGLGMSVIPIVVNRRPVVGNGVMAMSLGGRGSLANASGEMVVDDHGDDQILATIASLPTHGRLIRDGVPLPLGSTFVWQDFVNGVVEYEQSVGATLGVDLQDLLTLSIADATGMQADDPLEVTINIDGRSPNQNWDFRFDVNNSQDVSALDALLIINYLNRLGESSSVLPLPG